MESALLSSSVQVGISIGTSALVGGVKPVVKPYMWGGIFSGGAQIIGGGFRIDANKGMTTGKAGGIKLGKSGVKILSLDKNNWTKAGGTLIKFGKYLRFDIGAMGEFICTY